MASKVWFITGASRGFGRVWATAALNRGDKVAACARDTDAIADLVGDYGDSVLPVELDVTDRDAVFSQFALAHQHFERIDVVLNNAGYGLFGAIEENTEKEVRDLLEVNLFGALWVIQAAIPFLREQGSGHILSTSSMGGVIAFPLLGTYHASKWALEALNESLSKEVAQFGIHVTLIEPGAFQTEWSGTSAVRSATQAEYDEIRQVRAKALAPLRGDPEATASAILSVVDSGEPPLRLALGNHCLPLMRQSYTERLATWAEWEAVSIAAQGSAG